MPTASRLVHHHEHGVEALVLGTDEPARRPVIVHDAGRIAVDAHLVLDRAALERIARAQRAVRIDHELRHHEERDALGAGRRALDAGQHQMDDVLGHVVLAGRDEDLGAGDGVGAVAVGHGLGLEQAQIRAAVRLGQVHRAGPGPFDHLGHIGRLDLVIGVDEQRRDRALGQAGIHAKRQVRRGHELLHDGVERRGQALAAIFGRRGEAEPAALAISLVGVLEALRRGHRAVRVALAALLVARQVERREHLLGELGALLQDRLDHVRGRVREAGQVVVAVEMEDVVQQEQDVVDGCLVHGHRSLSSQACQPSRPILRRYHGVEADLWAIR